jgi:hypothetical protein
MKNRDDLHPFRWNHHRAGLTLAAEPLSPTVPEQKKSLKSNSNLFLNPFEHKSKPQNTISNKNQKNSTNQKKLRFILLKSLFFFTATKKNNNFVYRKQK